MEGFDDWLILLTAIPDQRVKADTLFALNVSSHFYDEEGDVLGYYVDEKSPYFEQQDGYGLDVQHRSGLLMGKPAPAACRAFQPLHVKLHVDDGRGGEVHTTV